MVLSFDRPVGAPADVAELEYVSALHQTAMPEARMDGSLDAADIHYYLRSRFGVQVSEDAVRKTIMQGLGGSDQTGEVIDLMEIMAVLLIPYLVKMARSNNLPADMVAPDPNVMKHVWGMILHDVFLHQKEYTKEELKEGPPLTADLIRRILKTYGETDMAENESIVQSMLEQVDGHERFDAAALLEACTADVQLYDPADEVRYTTTFRAVMEDKEPKEQHEANNTNTQGNDSAVGGTEGEASGDSELGEKEHKMLSKPPELKLVHSAPAIDVTADTFWSKTLVVSLWAGVLFSYFAFSLQIGMGEISDVVHCPEFNTNGDWSENSSVILCSIGASVVSFLIIFTTLCFFGVTWIGLGSLGNEADNNKAYKPLIASFCLLVIVIVPEIEEAKFSHPKAFVKYLISTSIILTSLTVFLHWAHAVYLLLPLKNKLRRWIEKRTLRDDLDLNLSMGFKINQLVSNAIEIHHSKDQQQVVRTCFGHGLAVFAKWKTTERVGGIFWVWQGIWSGDLARREGVSYSARLVAANVSQYFVVVFVFMTFVYAGKTARENYNKDTAMSTMHEYLDYIMKDVFDDELLIRVSGPIIGVVVSFLRMLGRTGLAIFDCAAVADVETLCPDIETCESSDARIFLCGLVEKADLSGLDEIALLARAGLDLRAFVDYVEVAVQSVMDSTFESLYPDEIWMLTIPIATAMIISVFSSLFLALGYLPSITATTLKLRTGVIPTLGDKKLNEYRAAPDTVTLLIGSLFWGCLLGGVLVGGIVGLIVFLLLWQGSLYFTQKVIAISVGISVVGALRFVILLLGRLRYFEGFYRKKPAAANIYFLAMDWANFGLAAGFVFVRMMKLLIVAAFSVGRIDTDFLAKGVGEVGKFQFDPFPTIHTRELMSHDAHRHPYIELLGKIYLMKLRYGTKFASTPGSCWRLVFVYALMPWLQKYRIFDAPSKRGEESDFIITEEDFSSLGLEKLNARERSSLVATPAMLKSKSRGRVGSVKKSAASFRLALTENEILQAKVTELEASKVSLASENDALRKRVEELERSSVQ